MPTTIESSGKTLDEAIRSGLSAMGVEREAVTVEILSKPKTGFFGIGSTLAKVKLTLTVPEKPASFEKTSPAARAQRPEQPSQPRVQKPPPQQIQQRPPQKPAFQQPRQEQPQVRAERPANKRATIPATDEDVKKAEAFITELLKHMDMGMTAETTVKDGVIHINLNGENVGNLIGRHGETLDAIQHIVTNVVNLKRDNATVRVQVDAADYRSKRQAALEQLARRMADNAKKYNSNMTLEPMNAYERHIIHVTLQDVPGIATFSTGSEPQRRVIISSANAQRRRRDNNDRRPPRDNKSRPPRDDRATRSFPPSPAEPPRRAPAPYVSAKPAVPAAPSEGASAPPQPKPRSLPVKEFGVKKP